MSVGVHEEIDDSVEFAGCEYVIVQMVEAILLDDFPLITHLIV